MSDENSPQTVAHEYDPRNPLAAENASLRARLAAMESRNVVEGRFNGEVPRYLLNESGFYDDTFFVAGTVLDYLDAPNLTMVPQNEAARRRLQDEIDRQTEGARDVAALRGRRFVGLVNDRNVLIDEAMRDAKMAVPTPIIQMPTAHSEPPPMPHLAEAQMAQRRGPGRPRKAVQIDQGPTGPQDRGAPMLAPTADPASLGPAVVGHRVA